MHVGLRVVGISKVIVFKHSIYIKYNIMEITELERKIYKGEKLTKKELREAVWGCEEVAQEVGENRRWSRNISSIIKIKDKLFCINWEQGLTEYQDNCYDEQPFEVEEKVEIIERKYYIRKK